MLINALSSGKMAWKTLQTNFKHYEINRAARVLISKDFSCYNCWFVHTIKRSNFFELVAGRMRGGDISKTNWFQFGLPLERQRNNTGLYESIELAQIVNESRSATCKNYSFHIFIRFFSSPSLSRLMCEFLLADGKVVGNLFVLP